MACGLVLRESLQRFLVHVLCLGLAAYLLHLGLFAAEHDRGLCLIALLDLGLLVLFFIAFRPSMM